ncbi:MAG: PIN domain-containing protein, partial [Candidatus Daviesbacteria bacterium]|nr:PIN domain-containing protein [Candidatus Daviesbacteria bacterium]
MVHKLLGVLEPIRCFLVEIDDHFDSSVICEILTDKPKSNPSREKCREYLYKVLTQKKARMTLLNLGELNKVILYKITERNDKLKAIDTVKDWLDGGVELCSPQYKAFEIALELKVRDWHLEPLDMLHIATAIEKKAKRFVTIEDSILKKK